VLPDVREADVTTRLHQSITGGYEPAFDRDLARCVTYADLVRLVRSRGVKVPMHGSAEELPDDLRGYMVGLALHGQWIRSGRRVVRLDAAAVEKLATAPPADASIVPRIGDESVTIVEFDPHSSLTWERSYGPTIPYVGAYLAPDLVDGHVGGYMFAALEANGDGIVMGSNTIRLQAPATDDGTDALDVLLWNLCAALADRRISHVVEFPRASVEGRRAKKRGVSLRRLVLADDLRGVWVTRKIGPPAVLAPAESIERGPVAVHVCHAHTARRWVVDAPVEQLERDADGFTVQRKNAGGRLLYAARVPVREHVRGTATGARVERVTT
jgi:hypothetical protein